VTLKAQHTATTSQKGWQRASVTTHASRLSSKESAMSEEIDHPRRRFSGTAAMAIDATSAVADAFNLFPQLSAHAVVQATRSPNT
jgi:hypothetical protein